MKDPLDSDGAERDLFEAISKLALGKPQDVVWGASINLLINSIRQCTAQRKDAEAIFDQLFGRAKSVLLDQHYDPVTGHRRGVFPYTQVIQMPFHDEGNVIFHGQ